MLGDGRRLLEKILTEIAEPAYQASDGQRCLGARSNRVLSLLGPVSYQRSYYQAPANEGICPKDQVLGIISGCTPGAARVLCRSVARVAYRESSRELSELAGLEVDPSVLQRLALRIGPMAAKLLPDLPGPELPAQATVYVGIDGTGVPMHGKALAGRQGREPGTDAKTREFKLAALFTQSTLDKEGKPVRDEDSTTYLGGILTSDCFGPVVRKSAQSRKIAKAARVVVLGDGAAWIWELARVNFPLAIWILDYFHACEHATALSRLIYQDPGSAANMAVRWKALLYESQMDELFEDVQTALDGAVADPSAERELEYFRTNRSRMDYKAFREQGLFIGSGVVEAGCKQVIAQRMKNSGMHWSVEGADAVAALRCASLSEPTWNQLWNRILPQRALAA